VSAHGKEHGDVLLTAKEDTTLGTIWLHVNGRKEHGSSPTKPFGPSLQSLLGAVPMAIFLMHAFNDGCAAVTPEVVPAVSLDVTVLVSALVLARVCPSWLLVVTALFAREEDESMLPKLAMEDSPKRRLPRYVIHVLEPYGVKPEVEVQ
jgi:hypothetical protein